MSSILANNAHSTLVVALSAAGTTAYVVSGDSFPTPTGDDWFPVVLGAGMDDTEICRCTARSGSQFTLSRGEEDTAARAWPAGTPVEVRLTAGALFGV